MRAREIVEALQGFAPMLSRDTIPVYSVEIGDYDSIAEPISSDVFSFYLFTDRKPSASSKWNYIDISKMDVDRLALARAIKICAHVLFPQRECVLYHDASFVQGRKFSSILKTHPFEDILLFRHPDRSSVVDEMEACIKAGKEGPGLWNRAMGFPGLVLEAETASLFASGFIGRNTRSSKVCAAMDDWLRLIVEFSRRDQISLPSVLHRNGVSPCVIDLNIYLNDYLVPRPHTGGSPYFKAKWALKRYFSRREVPRVQ